MREIKFRAWDNVNKRIARIGTFISDDGNFYVNADPNGVDMGGVIKLKHSKQYEFAGMFTEIKDKKGVDVYEGDIIRYGLAEGLGQPERKGLKREVKYSHFGFFGLWDKDIQVIGNIYENPELL